MKKYGFAVIFIILLIGLSFEYTHQKPKATTILKKTGTMVALGDSVAAGVGLRDASDSSACDRTNESYANLVSENVHYDITNLACSGATISLGLSGSQTVNNLPLPTQLDALFAIPSPKLITLTIGANDAGWIQAISKCYTGICGTDADTAIVNARLATVTTDLRAALQQINEHYSGTKPTVIVTGYYQLFPAAVIADCNEEKGIDGEEVSWIRSQIVAISSAVKAALPNQPNIKFVEPDFTGHELCTAEPWVQGLGEPQLYHPTAKGQVALAKIIETEVSSNQ